MRRTKQAQEMIDTFNTYFKNNRIKSEYDTTFHVACLSLMNGDTYRGFQWYKTNADGFVVTAWTKEDAEFIQLM